MGDTSPVQPAIPSDSSGSLQDDCRGCRSKERVADSELWKLFNASGKVFKKQAEHEAQAMGWNRHFEEFVPVRYAEQLVSGQRFFVRVQIDRHGVFIDALIVRGFSNKGEPTLKGIRVGKDEKDPIDDF